MYKAFSHHGRGARSPPAARTSSIIPQKLNPAADESTTMIVPAKGVQIYECRASKTSPAPTSGRSSRPTRELFDTTGRPSASTTPARAGKRPTAARWWPS